ncbi:MAG: hypothetical protein EXS58_14145 [Candidatus Latescibacteria bacterium]|nr:hypothetical protein [Candidatus Latescibacterota bacterium]
MVSLRPECGDGAAVADRLLDREALFVKDVSAKIGDGKTHLWLAVRLPAENCRLCAALAALQD